METETLLINFSFFFFLSDTKFHYYFLYNGYDIAIVLMVLLTRLEKQRKWEERAMTKTIGSTENETKKALYHKIER